jgi:hypothetical protein
MEKSIHERANKMKFEEIKDQYNKAVVNIVNIKLQLAENYNELEKAFGKVREAYYTGLITKTFYLKAKSTVDNYQKYILK